MISLDQVAEALRVRPGAQALLGVNVAVLGGGIEQIAVIEGSDPR